MSLKKEVTNREILKAVQLMGERLGGVEERMGGMEERMGGMEEHMGTMEHTIEGMHERMNEFATKTDLEDLKDDLLAEIRPIAKAVDADAVSIVNHEKRITKIEKRLALSH